MGNIDIQPGNHEGTPTCWGFTTSKNGHDQFAIEFAIETTGEDGNPRTIHMTRFGGLEGEGFQYTVQDLRTCGWVGEDLGAVQLDTAKKVRLVVFIDGEWGPKIKSIYSLDGGGGGALIRKQAMDEEKKRALAAKLNARLAQLPKTPGASSAKPAAAKAGGAPAGFARPGDDDQIPF
jgi:hypothetical protein